MQNYLFSSGSETVGMLRAKALQALKQTEFVSSANDIVLSVDELKRVDFSLFHSPAFCDGPWQALSSPERDGWVLDSWKALQAVRRLLKKMRIELYNPPGSYTSRVFPETLFS